VANRERVVRAADKAAEIRSLTCFSKSNSGSSKAVAVVVQEAVEAAWVAGVVAVWAEVDAAAAVAAAVHQ
jgi:hypothetical protein